MNEKNSNSSIEDRLRKINILWISFLIVSFSFILVFLLLNMSNIISEYQQSGHQSYNSTVTNQGITSTINGSAISNIPLKSLSVNSIILSILLFLVSIIIIFGIFYKGRSIHYNTVIKPFFDNLSILKTTHSSGIIPINQNKRIVVHWSDKGYFILQYNDVEEAYAKSTELYWKILFLMHKILIDEI